MQLVADLTSADEVLAVLDALRKTGCRATAAGGWGVDALVGHQTRDDLDLAVDAGGLDALDALARLGYVVETDCLTTRPQLAFRRGYEPRDVDQHDIAMLRPLAEP